MGEDSEEVGAADVAAAAAVGAYAEGGSGYCLVIYAEDAG